MEARNPTIVLNSNYFKTNVTKGNFFTFLGIAITTIGLGFSRLTAQ